MLQDRNLHRVLIIDKNEPCYESGHSHLSILTRIMIFFDILIVIGVIYVGYCVWDFVRFRYHLIEHPCWKRKWMKKNKAFPIPLSRCASTPFIHFHCRTEGWEELNGDSKSKEESKKHKFNFNNFPIEYWSIKIFLQ